MNKTSRRRFLTTVGGVSAVAIAGCLDSGRPDGNAPESLSQPVYGEKTENKPVLKLFEDYGCPACADFEENVLPQLISDYVEPDTLYIEFYDFPIPVRQLSKPAGVSGRVVQDLSEEQVTFWDYKRQVFANQNNLGYELFRTTANDLGLDGDEVVKQTRSGEWNKFVEQNKQYGQEIGVSGTPGLFINDTQIDYGNYSSITTQIELELRNQ